MSIVALAAVATAALAVVATAALAVAATAALAVVATAARVAVTTAALAVVTRCDSLWFRLWLPHLVSKDSPVKAAVNAARARSPSPVSSSYDSTMH